MTTTRPIRFGLVGTGYWARSVHAPALASTAGIELAAIWGRDHHAAATLAARHGTVAIADLDEFLATVDAVDFSVPPDVQSSIAVRAARAGKHVLLEKPVALSLSAADELVSAVESAGVASVVFFTSRFEPAVRTWLDGLAGQRWRGGGLVWLTTALDQASPFNTPWRRDQGSLWDLGPHAVSMLWACLGPVTSVTADTGQADVTHLVLHHESGASSTITTTLSAPDSADCNELWIWGDAGRLIAPTQITDPIAALRVALTELAAGARSGATSHPCDVSFGRDVVRVLTQAQQQIDSSQVG